MPRSLFPCAAATAEPQVPRAAAAGGGGGGGGGPSQELKQQCPLSPTTTLLPEQQVFPTIFKSFETPRSPPCLCSPPQSLKRRALLVVDAFNTMEGVSCNPAEGAMYVFPRLRLPQRALDEAAAAGKPADFLYCVELLEKTGIVTVPGGRAGLG